jgi:hypothetical protein
MRSLNNPKKHRESKKLLGDVELSSKEQEFSDWIGSGNFNTVVFSCEHLSSCNREDVRLLKLFLERFFDSVIVVIYFRDPLKSSISWWSTQVKGNYKFKKLPSGLPNPIQTRRYFCAKSILDVWGSEFNDSIKVKIFNRSDLLKGDLIVDFYSEVSKNLNLRNMKPTQIANESLGWSTIKIINSIDADFSVSHPIIHKIYRKDIVNQLNLCESKKRYYIPSAEEIILYEEVFSDHYDALAKWTERPVDYIKGLMPSECRKAEQDKFYSLELDQSDEDLKKLIKNFYNSMRKINI